MGVGVGVRVRVRVRVRLRLTSDLVACEYLEQVPPRVLVGGEVLREQQGDDVSGLGTRALRLRPAVGLPQPAVVGEHGVVVEELDEHTHMLHRQQALQG